jgi:toxin ParE1/3/4
VSRSIVVSPEAEAQLDDLYDYIAEAASPTTASRFLGAIVGRLESLGEFPMVGSTREDISPGLRTIGFRRRVTIAFTVDPDKVEIVGVFYGGQDFEAILAGD